ncbi:MAG: ATP-binding protein [Acidimicrobiales bacterium]|nr:ATP-binding protein [Acidimicrobiales bacterium]
MAARRLAVRSITGQVLHTRDEAIAWWSLGPQRWAFRSNPEREALVASAAQRLSQLQGRRLHLRVTTRPLAVQDWQKELTVSTRSYLPAWPDHVVSEARHLTSLQLTDKRAFLGVELGRSSARWLGRFGRSLERSRLEPELRDLDRIVAGPGLEGRPATTAELAWLVRRSITLGCAPPSGDWWNQPWETEDLAQLAEGAWWTVDPYGRTVRIETDLGPSGERQTCYIAVVCVGRMSDELPLDPWAAKTDRLPFPVELVATIDVLASRAVMKGAQTALLRVRSQRDHFVEHRLPPPFSLDRAFARAQEVQDEVEGGLEGLSTRTDSWWRVAVSGSSEEEALDRARQVVDLYAPQITAVRTAGQHGLAREMIPGEPLSSPAYRRRLPVTTLAAAMPAVTAQVGDRVGHWIGWTSGATGLRAVCWDLHRAMEESERSGMSVVAGTLGSGKSFLAGSILFRSVLAGVPWTVLDPAGALAKLTELPELAPYSRHVDLLHAPQPGILSPYSLIAAPRPDAYRSKAQFEHACSMTEATRRTLTCDILVQLLPAGLAEDAASLLALRQAARLLPATRQTDPRRILDELRKLKDEELARHARLVADFLEDLSELPACQLIFGSGTELDYRHNGHQAGLTVVSLAGLTLPADTTPRREWTAGEQVAVPMLQLAAHLATRPLYEMPAGLRKGLLFDEAHILTRTTSGRQLLQLTARQSRRLNLRALYLSQDVRDFETAGLLPHLDSAFIGQMEDEDAQRAACRALRIPEEYASVLGTLSQHRRDTTGRRGARSFVWSDGVGGCERITVDASSLAPHVRAALDTTPKVLEAVS